MIKKGKAYISGLALKKECVTCFIVEFLLQIVVLWQVRLISEFIKIVIFQKEIKNIYAYIVYFILWLVIYIVLSMSLKIIESDFRNKHRMVLTNKLALKMLNVKDIYLKYTVDDLKAFFEIDIPAIISSGFIAFKSMCIKCVLVSACIGLLFNISWQMTIVTLTILILSYVGELYLTLKLNKINCRLREEDIKINGFFTESIDKWEEIRNHNMQQFFLEWYYSLISKYIDFMNKWVITWENRNLYMDMKKMILQYILVYAVGGVFVGKGIIAPTSLILYGQIFVTMFSFVDDAINSAINIADSRVHFVKIKSFFKIEEYNRVGLDKNGHIKIDKISFGYSEDKEIFKDFSCDILPGKINVISGCNGVGKSTLCKIIVGMLPIQSGRIIVDGEDTSGISSSPDSDYYSFYSDSCSFFHAAPSEIIDDDKCGDFDNYLKYFQLDERFIKFEDGADTRLVDESCLSGGEKQRLFLIRTLLSKAQVLIFDEPTSALDTGNIELFSKKINKLRGKKTVILITHDSSLKKVGEHIIDLNNEM